MIIVIDGINLFNLIYVLGEFRTWPSVTELFFHPFIETSNLVG